LGKTGEQNISLSTHKGREGFKFKKKKRKERVLLQQDLKRGKEED